MKIQNVLVAIPADEAHRAKLEAAAPGASFQYIPAKEVTKEDAQKADVVIGNVAPALLTGSPNLKWVQLNSAGTDGYTTGALPEGTILTNATGAYGLTISEHMLALTLSLMKHLPAYRDHQAGKLWKDAGPVKSVYGSTVLILGLGDIGGEYARKVKALGGCTIGVRRTKAQKPDYLDELYQMDSLEELLPRADVVAMVLPGTDATYHVMNKERLLMMKKDAILVNVGRGNAIDPESLYEVMKGGHLWGVGLDVTEPEPLPAESPLWELPNLEITPHSSGGFHLQETYERIVNIALCNLSRFQKGEELENLVDFSTGYRVVK